MMSATTGCLVMNTRIKPYPVSGRSLGLFEIPRGIKDFRFLRQSDWGDQRSTGTVNVHDSFTKLDADSSPPTKTLCLSMAMYHNITLYSSSTKPRNSNITTPFSFIGNTTSHIPLPKPRISASSTERRGIVPRGETL